MKVGTRTKPLRIGLDLDNTFTDFIAGAAPLIKEHYGLEPDLTKQVYRIEEVFGLTPETRPPEMKEVLFEGLHVFRHLPLLEEDSYQLTHGLASLGVKIYIITARTPSPTIVEDTYFWLKENNFVYDDVFFTDYKAQLCSLIGVTAMLEDELGHIYDLIRGGTNVVVLDQPWNRQLSKTEYFHTYRDSRGVVSTDHQGKCVRVHNWRDALRVLEEFTL